MDSKESYTEAEVIEMLKAYKKVTDLREKHASVCPKCTHDPSRREELGNQYTKAIHEFNGMVPNRIKKAVFNLRSLDCSLD